MRRLSVSVLLLAVASLLTSQTWADTFSASASVFNNPDFCPVGLPNGTSSQPIKAASGCVIGNAQGVAVAEAGYGHVGVQVDANGLKDFNDMDNNATASLMTNVTFTGPVTLPHSTVVVNGTNVILNGVLFVSGGHGEGFDFSFDVNLNGADYGLVDMSLNGSGNFHCQSLGTFTCGDTNIAGNYSSTPVEVPLNTPVPLIMSVHGAASDVIGGGKAGVDFLNSLDLVQGSPVFNLPDGFTANDPDMFIVNNRFTPRTTAPEPGSLLLVGVGLAGFLRRRPRNWANRAR